ncbi:MAG: hypothetical protein R3236_02635 [Phycisphaeraceae bacterium]|nr:hypothetical protein [Phycisphaeraceae bacterium]
MSGSADQQTARTNATLVDWTEVHEGLAVWRVRPDHPPVPAFEPGQHIELGLIDSDGRLDRRVFSIASSAENREAYEFCAVRIPDGRWSARLWETARTQGRLWLAPAASGSFTLFPVAPQDRVVWVATGTGVAPFVSMARTYGLKNHWERCLLIHGVRHAADLVYRSTLEDLAGRSEALGYVPVVSREPDYDGFCGHVGDLLHDASFKQRFGFDLDPATCHIFLCGNPAMVDEQAEALGSLGFRRFDPQQRPEGRLHYEKYW